MFTKSKIPRVAVSATEPMPQLVITVSELDMATGQLFLLDSMGNIDCLLEDDIHFTESTSTVTVNVEGACAAAVQDLDRKRAKFLAFFFSSVGSFGVCFFV